MNSNQDTRVESRGMSEAEEVQRLKAEIWALDYVPEALRHLGADAGNALKDLPVIVAEGDSWFDYAPGIDVLDQLRRKWGYTIHKLSEGGDTLENMIYGTKIKRYFQREASGIHFVKEAVKTCQPRVVLFSAGGNDIAGDELMSYLNHFWSPASSGGTKWLRTDVWESALDQMESHIRVFAGEIWSVNPGVHIAMHGYARPVPDGRAVINAPFGFKFIGPWIRSSFAAKGYTDWKATQPWIAGLLDEYNELISRVASDLGPLFHYVDTRSTVGYDDWANELHPTNKGFERVATKIHDEVLSNF